MHNYEDKEGFIPPYTDELFVRSLLIDVKSDAMNIGSILHKMLETSNYNILPSTFKFDNYNIYIYEDIEIAIPRLREMCISKDFNDIHIRGKLDAVSATTIHDYKFTKAINYEKYIDSWQWRIYLWMTNKNYFVYDLFKIHFDEKNINILNYQPLYLEKYIGMKQEVEDMYVLYLDTLISLKTLIKDIAATNNIILKD